MDLKDIILSEINDTEKNEYYMQKATSEGYQRLKVRGEKIKNMGLTDTNCIK